MNPSTQHLRDLYLRYFAERGHAIIPSASLLPDGDPTVLYTTAGMHPLVPYLMGQPHPRGARLTGYQACLRTNDIEEVGDDCHLTFFEMLGNWSLGDYGRRASVRFSFEFLTSPDYLGLDLDRLWVTVFAGSDEVGRDEEVAAAWRELGVPGGHVVFLGVQDNWWAAGLEGPCGPDTEIFFDRTQEACPAGERCKPGVCDCDRFVEIWNNVFMDYDRRAGVLHPLPRPNVDTGMGLERMASILGGHSDVYAVDGLREIADRLRGMGTFTATEIEQDGRRRTALRIATDHLRSVVAVLGDARGVEPSNQGAGYVLRRLIRRGIRYSGELGISPEDWVGAAHVAVDVGTLAFPSLDRRRAEILASLTREANRFAQVRVKGERLLDQSIARVRTSGGNVLPGATTFKLYETYGFPIEFTRELAAEQGIGVDEDEYQRCARDHQERSRGERAKGGLVDSSVQSVRLHTATHLLQAALREILGPHVAQRGSNITPERLRFDFSHPAPLSDGERSRVEAWVQTAIDDDLPVTSRVDSAEQATRDGASGVFGDRYDERVSVYAIGDKSLEVCGGPHVQRTAELGRFRILKEGSCAAGIRRIRARLEIP